VQTARQCSFSARGAFSLPHPAYARLCRTGARAVSENFLRLSLLTTYLADRKTTLAEWERLRADLIMSF
jgi:hypothetical protein